MKVLRMAALLMLGRRLVFRVPSDSCQNFFSPLFLNGKEVTCIEYLESLKD